MEIEFIQTVKIKITTHGGGTHALHAQVHINDEFAFDTSGSLEYRLGSMFPDNEKLSDWIDAVEEADSNAYQLRQRLG